MATYHTTQGNSAEVRRKARAHLAELRRARLGRRATGPCDEAIEPEPSAVTEGQTVDAEGVFDAMPAAAVPDDAAVAVDPGAEAIGEAEDIPVDASTVPEALPDEPGVPDLERTDLGELPGAGPGLVWMLQSCGVRSLAELAAADPEDLKAGLGLVGRILDVDALISIARQKAGPGGVPGAHETAMAEAEDGVR